MHTFVQYCVLMNFVKYFFSSSIIFCIKWMFDWKNSLIYANVWLQKMFEYNKHFFADLMPFQKNVTFQKSWNISETERCRQILSNDFRVRNPKSTFNTRHFCFFKFFRFINQNFELLAIFEYEMSVYFKFGYWTF